MNIDSLIAKYILGKESKEELDQLNKWQNESLGSIDAISKMQDIWSDTDMLKDYQEFDTDSALAKMSFAPVSNVVSIRNRVIRYAAVAVLMLSCYFIYDTYSTPSIIDYGATKQLAEFTLNDGSVLELAPFSLVRNLDPGNNASRSYKLDGTAFFSVEKDKKRPFTIETKTGEVTVLGTRFSVNSSGGYSEIFVEEGSVKFTSENSSIVLTAGQFFSDRGDDFMATKASNHNYLSWKNDNLTFVNTDFATVISDLNRHFTHVKIVLDDSIKNVDCRVNASYKETNLESVLSDLSLLINLKFHKDGDTIVIDSVGC